MKQKRYSNIKRFLTKENIQVAVLLVILVCEIIILLGAGKFDINNFLQIGVFTSIVIAAFCGALAKMVVYFIERKEEDAIKLTQDYEKLCNQYCLEDMIQYKNADGKEEIFPEVCLLQRNVADSELKIIAELTDKNKYYSLPNYVAQYSDDIIKVHKSSSTYNNRYIRLVDFLCYENIVILKYMFTTYYDSLLTNRAMDYMWKNGRTVREIYEPGPFISSLPESKLSNHIGYNGFVVTSDDNIIFVKRSKNVSVAKGTLASVGAVMNTKYCLNKAKKLTEDGIYDAIAKKISDEFKIDMEDQDKHKIKIISFYRDLVEGGKPQFVFYYKLDNMTAAEVCSHFNDVLKNEDEKQQMKDGVIDGKKMYYYTVEQLRQAIILTKKIEIAGESHEVVPSFSASLVMLLRYLEEK